MQLVSAKQPDHYHIFDYHVSNRSETMCGFGGGLDKDIFHFNRDLHLDGLCKLCLLACAQETNYYRKNTLLKIVVGCVRFLTKYGIIVNVE